MINFVNIEKYKENNRIEAKKALGGFPRSIWETYSAFANTLGGIILLGVEERRDKSLHPVDLPAPEQLVAEFWRTVNNPEKVSANILKEDDVTVETVGDCRIVAIRVPRASRADKPVYIDGDIFSGSYRRGGEGDYRCTREEILALVRDAALKTEDMRLLGDTSLSSLCPDSINRYRLRIKSRDRELKGEELLLKLDAANRGEDGSIHPTAAGLLMFGYEQEIVKEYPRYSLTYQEYTQEGEPSFSISGGNVFDFYFTVCDRLTQNIAAPDGKDTDSGAIAAALREALANCLVNADYHGSQGISVTKRAREITVSNPGGFRIDIERAKGGGVSDPRNGALVKMFNLIDVCERRGKGISNIFNVWKKAGWSAPLITESFEPDRITLCLKLERSKHPPTASKNSLHRQAIIEYLTENISSGARDIAELLGLKQSKVKEILAEMTADGITVCEGEGKDKIYRLNS